MCIFKTIRDSYKFKKYVARINFFPLEIQNIEIPLNL